MVDDAKAGAARKMQEEREATAAAGAHLTPRRGGALGVGSPTQRRDAAESCGIDLGSGRATPTVPAAESEV